MKAIIIGGGVAGPTTAMALQRVGIESTVYEAHPPLDPELGSYFTMTANGLEALDAIGAMNEVEESGVVTRRNVLWNHAGRRLGTLPLDSSLPESPHALTIKRSRLGRNLQDEATSRGITVEYGKRLRYAATSADGSVEAVFEDGTTAVADLLIGADGVHSVVRKLIDPSAPPARYVGLTNFGGITRGVGADFEPESWHLIFGRRAFFGYQTSPNDDVIWFANVPRPPISPNERATSSDEQWRANLADLFESDAGPASELIEAGELELAADNTHDVGHVPNWHRDRKIVIGDAAHAPAPSSGQGASMAVEDAVALAAALADRDSIDEAFQVFESARRERVERIVAWGARGSSTKTPGPLGRVFRDFTLGLVFKHMVTEESLSWMYDYRVALDHRSGGGEATAA